MCSGVNSGQQRNSETHLCYLHQFETARIINICHKARTSFDFFLWFLASASHPTGLNLHFVHEYKNSDFSVIQEPENLSRLLN